MVQLKPELYRLIAHYVRYPTDVEKKPNPRIELARQADVLNMMKASKALHDACEIILYTHPLVDNFTMFVNATEEPVEQARWKYVETIRLYLGRLHPPYREDTFSEWAFLHTPLTRYAQSGRPLTCRMRVDPVEAWSRYGIDATRNSSDPLPTLFPKLRGISLYSPKLMGICRDGNGTERSVDDGLGLSLWHIAAGKNVCQTGVRGPLDIQEIIQPAWPVATFTYHPRLDDLRSVPTWLPVVLGAHNRCVYPGAPPNAGQSLRGRLSDLITQMKGMLCNTLTQEVLEDDWEWWELVPADLKTTTIELFGMTTANDLDTVSSTSPMEERTSSGLEIAQQLLDGPMGVWAGTIKLRQLSDAPLCPARVYDVHGAPWHSGSEGDANEGVVDVGALKVV